ncbi:MAG: response regulator [Bacteroidetes bacterium]|nr:response regulator [Bacteroidota bacterium]
MKNKNIKILFVDDDKELRTEIRDLLFSEGYDVSLAENGKEAIEILNLENIDLIISDIMMPVKNGYEFYSDIKKNEAFAALPFLFLTAKASYNEFRIGMDLGADDYITKPFDPVELLKAIKTRLTKWNKQLRYFSRKTKIYN